MAAILSRPQYVNREPGEWAISPGSYCWGFCPGLVIKSLKLIYLNTATCRWNLRMSDLQRRCSDRLDLTIGHQDSSLNNDVHVTWTFALAILPDSNGHVTQE